MTTLKTEHRKTAELELATFLCDHLLLGVELAEVEEINRHTEVTPVPGAPACVRGLINLRGEVVTVLDLKTILGLGTTQIGPGTRNVIVRSQNERIGLLVDAVSDVVRARRDELLPCPANFGQVDSRFFRAVYRLDGRLLVLLDVAAATAVES